MVRSRGLQGLLPQQLGDRAGLASYQDAGPHGKQAGSFIPWLVERRMGTWQLCSSDQALEPGLAWPGLPSG